MKTPERAGFVKHPIDWKHSSAIDYYTQKGKNLLELVRLDGGFITIIFECRCFY